MSKFKLLIVLFISVIMLQLVYAFIVFLCFKELSDRGLFGDMFGGITALFSGLAFAGMIYAIVLQSIELSLQREELKLTREEMKASREEQARSANAQTELVEKQLLTARIQGMSAIVQGRYQYAASYGSHSSNYVKGANEAEKILIKMMEEAGEKGIKLPPNM